MPGSHRHHRRRKPTPAEIAAARRRHILWLGLLVLLVYATALGGGFVWTDRSDLLQGEHRLTEAGDLPLAMSLSRSAYRERHSGSEPDPAAGSWQPLTLLSNSLSWGIWGDCSFCFHLENLLLHLATVIGLYALGRHILAEHRHGNRVAVWTAAVFAVHPTTVPSVAWIGGHAMLLAAAFGVWSLYVFARLPALFATQRARFGRWVILLAVTTAAAMLAHETAYMLPLAALLIATFDWREKRWGGRQGPAALQLAAVGLILAVLLGLLVYRTLVLGGLSFGAEYPTDSLLRNTGMAIRHLWAFVDGTLLPFEPTVSDAWPVIPRWGALETAALLGTLLILAATAFGLYFAHPSAFGVAWFLLWLIPGLGVFPSDHFHSGLTYYLAVWGLAFAIAFPVFTLWRPIGREMLPGSEALVFVPMVLVLGLITAFSNVRWWDQAGLFGSEITSDPHYIEGRLELAKTALEDGDPGAAQKHAMEAFEASNDAAFTGYWSPRDGYFVLGRAQWELGLAEAATSSFTSALEARPGDVETTYWLGVAQLAHGDHEAAEASLRKVLEVRPANSHARADLGAALAGQERYAEALPLLEQAIERDLGNDARHRSLALALIDAGRLEEAVPHLEATLSTREVATERARLAWVRWRLGQTQRANEDLNMALLTEEARNPYLDWVQGQMQSTTETD